MTTRRNRTPVNYAAFYENDSGDNDEEEEVGSDVADGSADDFEPSPPKRVSSVRVARG